MKIQDFLSLLLHIFLQKEPFLKDFLPLQDRLEKRWKSTVDVTAFAEPEMLEESHPATELVKTKKFHVDTMDVEEAILQMNMLGHAFFLFRSAEDGGINVVYRRHDGNYGLLQPLED